MPSERTGEQFRRAASAMHASAAVSRCVRLPTPTKISVGVLEALERNDISKLPGGIFGRAFVRKLRHRSRPRSGRRRSRTSSPQFPNDSVTAGPSHVRQGRGQRPRSRAERRTAGYVFPLAGRAERADRGPVCCTSRTLGRRVGPEAGSVPPVAESRRAGRGRRSGNRRAPSAPELPAALPAGDGRPRHRAARPAPVTAAASRRSADHRA